MPNDGVAPNRPVVIEVRDLHVGFKTDDGFVSAVNGLSYGVESGSTLGIVGESGSGKSVNALSVMRLIPMPPGKIVSGSISLRGQNLLDKTEAEMRKIRGKDIAMIFQDPMTSLNPVLTVGDQIGGSRTAASRSRQEGRARENGRHAAARAHPASREARAKNIRTSSPAACASA